MSLPSLSEQFRQQIPVVDRFCREQEQKQQTARLAQEALLAAQEHAASYANFDRWQARHQPDNDPSVYDAEVALKIAAEQGLTWSQVVLNGLHLQEAGKRMTSEVRQLDTWLFPPTEFQSGSADYQRPSRRYRAVS